MWCTGTMCRFSWQDEGLSKTFLHKAVVTLSLRQGLFWLIFGQTIRAARLKPGHPRASRHRPTTEGPSRPPRPLGPSLDPDCPSTGCSQMFMNYCNYPTCTRVSCQHTSRQPAEGPRGRRGSRPPAASGSYEALLRTREYCPFARPGCHLWPDYALSVGKKFPLLPRRIREVVPQSCIKTQVKGHDLSIIHGKRVCGGHGDHKLTLPHGHRGRGGEREMHM